MAKQGEHDASVRQYGGNIPPPGYVQFLVERLPSFVRGNLVSPPLLCWALATEDTLAVCPHMHAAYRVYDGCRADVARQTGKWPGVYICFCYGRIIE